MANLTEYPAPESHKNPEPPPTCPFINPQCQRTHNIRRGQQDQPDPCVPGDQCPSMSATVRFSASMAPHRPVRGHLCGSGDSGNPKNDSFWKFFGKSRRNRVNHLILRTFPILQARTASGKSRCRSDEAASCKPELSTCNEQGARDLKPRAMIAPVSRKGLKRERGAGGAPPPQSEAVPATVSGERDAYARWSKTSAASHWAGR